MYIDYVKTDLELMIGKDEEIFWRGKPNKLCYILEGMFNPMLPFALLWLAFDSMFIVGIINGNAQLGAGLYMIVVFFLLHLMPVWIYLGGVLTVFRRYRHTEYIITSKGVYVSGGIFSYNCDMKPFAELARVNIKRSVIDQIIGVGDIVLTGSTKTSASIIIEDIANYQEVFNIVKKLQEDIYTDVMYPNALRPEENHGYRTKYNGLN